MKMSRLRLTSAFVVLFALTGTDALAADLTKGASASTDLYVEQDAGPEVLLDGDDSTMFRMHRVEDTEFRINLASPSTVTEVTVIQAWEDWALPSALELESADGTVVRLALRTDTREPQTFAVKFPWPTALVDVRVVSAVAAKDGGTFGGMAEIQLNGAPSASKDKTPPSVSAFQVDKTDARNATLTFETDEPAACRVRFSEEDSVPALTPHHLDLATSHVIELTATKPLGGQVDLRCTDAAGNRAEVKQNAFTTIPTATFQWGMGGWAYKLEDQWIRSAELFKKDGLRVDFAQMWTDRSYDSTNIKPGDIEQMLSDGLLPEIIHFWVGASTPEEMTEKRDEYLADIRVLAENLKASGHGEEVLVTLEPEYNQGEMTTWDGWNDLMIDAIDLLHETAGAKVGLLPGPWDLEHNIPTSMGRAITHADFVALQSMAGSVTNEREEMKLRVDETLRFTRYLNRKFLRPVRLGYLMISDYGDWEDVQREVMIEYCERLPELQAAGMISLSWMGYLDQPDAEGALGEAEAHKGLRYKDGAPKPAYFVFAECAENGASWLESGEDPPGKIAEKKDSSGCGCRLDASSSTSSAGTTFVLIGISAALLLARRLGRRRPFIPSVSQASSRLDSAVRPSLVTSRI